MGKVNFSVTIPDNPQELAGLGERVNAKHVADGVTSVLNPLNMTDFDAKVTFSKTRDGDAKQLNRDKETAFGDRDIALGINDGNKDTVDYFVKAVRDVLLGINKGKEQNLGDHGFNVNMSDGFVSVEIPTDAPGLIGLADRIIKKHVLDGAASPIAALDMTTFTAKQVIADTKDVLGKKLNRDKEKATGESHKALGIAKGQTVKTPGTVKFYVTSARDTLLGFNRGNEFNLGDWGYDVQFSTGPGGPGGIFKAVPAVIAAGETSNLEWSITGAATVSIDNGIGTVTAIGSHAVTPAVSTTYKLTATASNGTVTTMTITLTVS